MGYRARLGALLIVLSVAGAALVKATTASHAENIGTVSQPLVAGTDVSAQAQQDQALVVVKTAIGRCSASLLNNEWVISATHCFSKNQPAFKINVIAEWPTPQTRVGTVVYDVGKDITILRVSQPFDNVAVDYNMPVYLGDMAPGKGVTVYGQGTYALASGSGAAAVPSQSDDKWRSANFQVTHVDADRFWFKPNNVGAIPAGGDSGGPAFINAGGRVYLSGISSLCQVFTIPGKPTGRWTWVNKIDECGYAPVAAVWPEIQKRIGTPQCRAYAWRAVGAVKLAQTTYNCAPEAIAGARFSSNFDDHLTWCAGAKAADIASEDNARFQQTQQCRIAAGMPKGNAKLMVAQNADSFGLSGGGYAVNTRVIIRATDSAGVQNNITSNFSDAKGTFSATVPNTRVCTKPGPVTFTAEDQDNKPSPPVTSTCATVVAAAPPPPAAEPPAAPPPGDAPPAPGPAPAPPQAQAIVNGDVDIYAVPDGDTPVLGILRKGTRVTPLQKNAEGWCQLQGIGRRGRDAWVWGEFVDGCN